MSRHQRKVLTVVIPLLNEAAHFRRSFDAISRHLHNLSCETEIILVDDGSTDDTWRVICELANMHGDLTGLRLSRNFGKEGAIAAGLERARGDAVIVMDGDLEHPPELLAEMVRLWDEGGADVVHAVKTSRGEEGFLRRRGGQLFGFLLTRFAGLDMVGATDFKLLDRKVVNAWESLGESQLFYRAMVTWLGFKNEKVYFQIPEQPRRRSSWSTWRLVALALTALTSFTSVPLRLVSTLGAAFTLLGLGLGVRALYLWLASTPISGTATIIVLQLIMGGCVMLTLSLIGHYVSNIGQEVRRRPRFVLADCAKGAPREFARSKSSAESEPIPLIKKHSVARPTELAQRQTLGS